MNNNNSNMALNIIILEKTGEISGIFDVIVKKYTDNIEKDILKTLRYDKEKNTHGPHVLKENLNEESSKIDFKYAPTFYRQTLSKNKLPYRVSDTVELIDTFSCIGSRFGLKPLSVFIEVYQSTCDKYKIWADIYYVADSEIPACTIKAITILKIID